MLNFKKIGLMGLVTVFFLVSSFLVVCGAEKPIELSYWTLFSGGEGDYMTAMVKQFNDEHPNIN
jgi:ABC-type glycerol-3-phosphate transport system substrate-binding protein